MDAGADAARMEAVSRANACWRQISGQTGSQDQQQSAPPRDDDFLQEMMTAASHGRTAAGRAAEMLQDAFDEWDSQDRARTGTSTDWGEV